MTLDEQSYNQDLPPEHTPPPKVLHNRPLPDGTVEVTYSLPGLRRVSVRVPEHRWREGGHLLAARSLAAGLAELDRQDAAISARLPGE